MAINEPTHTYVDTNGYTTLTKLSVAESLAVGGVAINPALLYDPANSIADLTDSATGEEIAAAVNAIIAVLVDRGFIEAAEES